MNKDSGTPQFSRPNLIAMAGLLIAVILFTAYVYFYQVVPLKEPWNDLTLNAIAPVAALLAASVATAVYLYYHPEDLPRQVWLHLSIGAWLWFLGDTLWAILAYQFGEVETPSVADAAWIAGIGFFSLAFYYQYKIVFPDLRTRIIQVIAASWAFALIAPAVGLWLTGSFEWGAYVDYFYPASEILIGIAGIALVAAFQGGALVRPWIGMVVFSISDFFYAWAEQSGLYEWSSANNDMLTLAIDISYLVAYLILGMGFLGQWLLIKYGLRPRKK